MNRPLTFEIWHERTIARADYVVCVINKKLGGGGLSKK